MKPFKNARFWCLRGLIEGGDYFSTRPSTAGIIRVRVLFEGGSYLRKYGSCHICVKIAIFVLKTKFSILFCARLYSKLPKGQVILKGLFGILGFFQKINEQIHEQIRFITNSLVCFLEESGDTKSRFEIIWPLIYVLIS